MKLNEIKDIWRDSKGKLRIIDGMGKYIKDDKKTIQEIVDKNRDEFLYTIHGDSYVTFGFDKDLNSYIINGKGLRSLEKFRSFDDMWNTLEKKYRKN
jgi:hypothetical protein